MASLSNGQFPKKVGPNELDFHNLIVAGMARVIAKVGKGTLADKMGRSTRQIDNIMAGSTPEAKALFDTLLADRTSLDEIHAAYGFRITPLRAEPANDMNTISGLAHAVGEWIERLRDQHRCHQDTLALAALFRPLLPHMQAIVQEADAIKRGEGRDAA